MPAKLGETPRILAAIPDLEVQTGVSLASYTRFGIGGPAGVLAETSSTDSLIAAWRAARESGLPATVIGGGSNLIVADRGFQGIVLRFTADGISLEERCVTAGAGAELQALVDFTIDHGLRGLETLTRIPGWVGGAIYGNAGAYGHSICERVLKVTYTDGRQVHTVSSADCQFRYRHSVFKAHKDWVILSVQLSFEEADPEELWRIASDIQRVRDQKYPPTMRCAGSIFKNLLLAEMPDGAAAQVPGAVVREGKVPAAWFLEQVGAKGMTRGSIRVADYHANLIYNAGGGTAHDLCVLIGELKNRVRARFGLDLREEVQYVG